MSKNANNGKPSTKPATPTQALSTEVSKDMLALMGSEAGAGFENASSADFSIPFLSMLQDISPMCKRSDPAYNAEAIPGMFHDASTGELLTEVRVVPCHYARKMVEWKPSRGGFAGQHDPGIEVGLPVNAKGQPELPNGNFLADTRYFFCLRLKEDGEATPVIIALASSQIKKAKTWMTRMDNMRLEGPSGKFRPPMYSHIWKLSSMQESNDQGTWFGYKMEVEGPVNAVELFKKAKESRTVFQSTTVTPTLAALEEGGDRPKALGDGTHRM